MDLRSYYKKVREAEATLKGDDIVLVSLATPEGGKPGVLTEAPRGVASKLIAEGRARVKRQLAIDEGIHVGLGLQLMRARDEQRAAAGWRPDHSSLCRGQFDELRSARR